MNRKWPLGLQKMCDERRNVGLPLAAIGNGSFADFQGICSFDMFWPKSPIILYFGWELDQQLQKGIHSGWIVEICTRPPLVLEHFDWLNPYFCKVICIFLVIFFFEVKTNICCSKHNFCWHTSNFSWSFPEHLLRDSWWFAVGRWRSQCMQGTGVRALKLAVPPASRQVILLLSMGVFRSLK